LIDSTLSIAIYLSFLFKIEKIRISVNENKVDRSI